MFKNCKSLTVLTLNNIYSYVEGNKNYKLKTTSMFEGCINLEELNISNMQFENEKIESENMFKDCNKLRKIICLEHSFNYFMDNNLLTGTWKWKNNEAIRTDI